MSSTFERTFEAESNLPEGWKEGKEIREELDRYHLLLQGLDAVDLPMHLIDTNYIITYINKAAADLLGVSKQDAIGKRCADLYKTGNCNTAACPCRVAMNQDRVNRCDNTCGDIIIDCTGAPLKDKNGTIIGSIEYFPDVTAQKRAVKDILRVADEAGKGNLAARTELAIHEGDYLAMAKGINAILDAVIDPLNVAADYVERISKGDIPKKITDTYHGDFNVIKNNLNQCIDAVNLLVADANMLAKAGVEGRLNTRADATLHQGDFKKIVEGVNATLDAVIEPLNLAADFIGDVAVGSELKKITGDYRGDYAQIKDSINKCNDVLYGLLGEIGMLTQAAVNGKLETRGDTKKFEGAWIQVVGGINATLDAVVGPINEAMRISEAYAKGNFTARVSEDLKVAGDFAAFKQALNNIGIQISETVLEINAAIEQVEVGTNDASKGSEEIAKAAEEVALTSQRCADLSKKVLDQIEDIDRQIADLSASNEEIASTSQEVLERSLSAAQQGKNAQTLGNEANTKMVAVERIAQQSVQEIEGLNVHMREITNIVRMITDIANQVNLLALNAAIEAARAGEHGRGFAVVAGEVRNLAGEAKGATQHIEKVIDGIQASSEKTAAAIKSAHSEIGSGVNSVNKAIEALNKIIDETEVVAQGIGEIAKATEDQANVTNNVVNGMGAGTRLLKENQGQVENLAALAEEASASTEEIGSAAHELSSMAGRLKQTMKAFKV